MLKVIYSIVVGLLVVLFVGVGIDAFYPGPDYPEPSKELRYAEESAAEKTETAELRALRIAYDEEMEAHQTKQETYNRNVSIIALVAAIIVLSSSLILMNKLAVITDGLMMGGLFTTLYSIIRGFESGDSRFRFLMVTVGLVAAIGIGYIKFVRPLEAKSKSV